ncbi:MAG: hypothetical protein JWP97_1184 [Labilithrix sp.]|nr:hypothetical protein [Labilithrix sp.]
MVPMFLRLTRLPAAALIAAGLATAACAPVAREAGPATPTVEYVAAQEILTPLPLRVRLPAAEDAEHVVVLFHLWGERGWKNVELARRGQTWSGEISCREVSTVTGDARYFFVVLDDRGEIVGGSGSPDWPHVATIVGKLRGGPRSLPGDDAVLRCHDPADCPPDFPGCPAYAVARTSCRSDHECGGTERCAWDGYCGSASADGPTGGEPAVEDLALAVERVQRRYRSQARK